MATIDTTLPGLEWMAEEQAAERAAAHATDTDRVRAIRERQSAQRRAQSARTVGTPLSASESRWLFKDAQIVEVAS